MRQNIANYITIARIVISIFMLLFDITSIVFMILYLTAALSDVIDGFVARKMNIQSKLGSELDTFSDIVFFVVFVIKVWNILHLQTLELIALTIIILIKITSIIIHRILTHSYIVDNHSIINKITGILLFFLPISINLNFDKYYIIILLIFAIVAASDELIKVIKKISRLLNKVNMLSPVITYKVYQYCCYNPCKIG